MAVVAAQSFAFRDDVRLDEQLVLFIDRWAHNDGIGGCERGKAEADEGESHLRIVHNLRFLFKISKFKAAPT